MAENTIGGCTGNCHSCGSSCDTQTGERKPSFFDRLESISEHFEHVSFALLSCMSPICMLY